MFCTRNKQNKACIDRIVKIYINNSKILIIILKCTNHKQATLFHIYLKQGEEEYH